MLHGSCYDGISTGTMSIHDGVDDLTLGEISERVFEEVRYMLRCKRSKRQTKERGKRRMLVENKICYSFLGKIHNYQAYHSAQVPVGSVEARDLLQL